MLLSYWYCAAKSGNDNESLVGRSKKEVEDFREELGPEKFTRPVHKTIEYLNGYDLFVKATGEGGCRAMGVTSVKDDPKVWKPLVDAAIEEQREAKTETTTATEGQAS